MKIQTRLLGAFGVVALICAIVGLVGWRGISQTRQSVLNLSEGNVIELEGIGETMQNLNAIKSAERTMINPLITSKEREHELNNLEKRWGKLDEGWKQFTSTESTKEEQAAQDRATGELAAWKAEHQRLVAMVRNLGSDEAANHLTLTQAKTLAFGSEREAFNTFSATVEGMLKATTEAADAEHDRALAAAGSAITISIIIMLLGVISAMILGFVIARQITMPMLESVKLAEEIAKGIFTSRLKLSRKDEIGQLTNALDHMAEALSRQVEVARTIAGGDLTVKVELSSPQDTLGQALQTMQQGLAVTITQTKLAGNEIANGALQIADSSQSLAQGASEQASSLEEISSAMTQMSSQTKMTADNAHKAQELSNAASTAAEDGNHQMQQMVEAMEEIRIASQSVANVIKVIEEIAFQTNMLALNAAVEAAHAGQHGKGFAVVAEEVRNLAARSAKAAKETADLIAGSVSKTENGAKIADQTAASLVEITNRIAQASDLVRSIAEAAREQSQGIDQVSQGLHQIDQVTQQNSANAEEGAAASEELSGQASQLNQLMQSFKVDSGNTVINPVAPDPSEQIRRGNETAQSSSWAWPRSQVLRLPIPAK